jgi:hypothetical protein
VNIRFPHGDCQRVEVLQGRKSMLRSAAVVLVTTALGLAQQIAERPRADANSAHEVTLQAQTLTASSVTALSVPSFIWYRQPKCDADGDVFFHTGRFDGLELFELSHSGDQGRFFKVDPDSKIRHHFGDYTVSPSGTPYVLTETLDGLYLAAFKSDGTVGSLTRLDAPEYLRGSIAVFDSGTTLLVAHFTDRSPEELRGKNYAALFASSGKLIKELNTGLKATDLGKLKTSLAEGASSLADDGNAYILTGNEVLVVSEAGEIVRRLPFDKPNDRQIATQVIASGGLVAIVLSSVGTEGSKSAGVVSNQLLLLDSSNGEPFRLYAADEMGSLACFSRSEGFTSLYNDSGKLFKATAAIH